MLYDRIIASCNKIVDPRLGLLCMPNSDIILSIKFGREAGSSVSEVNDFTNVGFSSYWILLFLAFLEKVSGIPDFREGFIKYLKFLPPAPASSTQYTTVLKIWRCQ